MLYSYLTKLKLIDILFGWTYKTMQEDTPLDVLVAWLWAVLIFILLHKIMKIGDK